MELELAARTEAGPSRPLEQMALLYRTFGRHGEAFAAVADGSAQGSGHLAAAVTLASVMERVASFLPDLHCPEPTPDARVREGLHLAHQRILDRAAREPLWMGTGASVVVAHFREEQLRLTHVGSARAYRLREGVLTPLTEDHSLANELRRQGQPIAEGSVQSFERILFRLVGAESERFEVEEHREPVAPGDVYVLCSRPLAMLLGEERMAAVLLRHDVPARALCDELMSLADGAREALKEWANLSVVVVRVLAGGA